MAATELRERPDRGHQADEATAPTSLTHARLSDRVPVGIAVAALAAASAIVIPLAGFNLALIAVVALGGFSVALHLASRRVEGARRAVDRTVTTVVSSAFALAVLPLVSVMWTVIQRGAARIDGDFFTMSMRNILGEGGGASHAVAGTLIITGLAALISVPIGIMVAIYLVEYGRGPLARGVTLLVDVMTGIPSIVAGLFAAGLFTALYGPGTKNGFAGAVALSVLMIPIVVRAAEEMLRLVPNELREASYGLGVPKWRTITKVVLPTSIGGILTGITLAIARVIGETAPLLIAVGTTDSLNLNPFAGRMETLPIFAYYQYQNPQVSDIQASYDRSWAASLLLMLIVMLLFGLARVLARVLRPKGSK
ncbi:phosphate ABC transporter permease PstA [Euzebya sp.]|uniref:phosphate ABC transporter permease PstA n=1 Tax=Euzebya sp. TaxID=1971409 RepID=UPI003512651B